MTFGCSVFLFDALLAQDALEQILRRQGILFSPFGQLGAPHANP